MSAYSINGNGNGNGNSNGNGNGKGKRPFNLQTLTSVLAGNPFPLISRYLDGKLRPRPATTVPDSQPQVNPAPAPDLAPREHRAGGVLLSLGETLERVERTGYEFGCASGATEVSDADEKRLAERARVEAVLSLKPAFNPQQNAGDAESAAAHEKRKANAADAEQRLPYVIDTRLKAENAAARVQSPVGERPTPPQHYVIGASILLGLMPFLTMRDLLVSGVSEDAVFINVVAAATAWVIGFVPTYGLFQAPPLKAGEGSSSAWLLAVGLSLSLFIVRLSFGADFLLSLGFAAFEFCAVCLVEHFARRHRLSVYDWDAAHHEKQEVSELVAVAKAREQEVEQHRQAAEADMRRYADELSLRELQARAPQEWEAKLVSACLFGHARAVAENKARQQAERASLDAETIRISKT